MTEARDKANVMIVDDTPANLKLLEGMLKEHGYNVRPLPKGRLALRAAENDPPDVILLDINMPEMNGYEVCKRLKADERLAEIPVIFLSALNETADKVAAFAAGGVDFVTKPFQFEEVQARVETHLKLRRYQVELAIRAAWAEGLQRAAEELVACETIEDLAEAATRAVVEHLDLRMAFVSVLTDDGRVQVLACSSPDHEVADDESECPLQVFRTAQPIIVNDTIGIPPFPKCPDTARGQDFRSCATFPVLAGSECLATFTARCSRGGRDGPLVTAAPLLEVFCRQIGYVWQRCIAESVLAESEERSRLLLESTPDAMVIIDSSGTIQVVNSRTESMFGFRREELVGQAIEILVPEGFREGHPARRNAFIADPPPPGTRTVAELWAQRADGSVFPVEISLNPLRTQEGLLVLASVRDITERRQAQDELKEREQRFSSLVANIPGAVYRCALDEHWTMEYLSDRIEDISGYPASDFIANKVRTYASIIHPEDVEVVDQAVEWATQRNTFHTIEYRIAHADGTIRWVHEKGQVIRDGECLDGVVSDITERKTAEDLLRKHTSELERFRRLAVDRELRMITMKEEVNELLGELDRDEKYKIVKVD